MFVDAGWFLDIPPYFNRTDGMTFEKCARAVAHHYSGTFDECAPLPYLANPLDAALRDAADTHACRVLQLSKGGIQGPDCHDTMEKLSKFAWALLGSGESNRGQHCGSP
jgi:hypothetical protein